MSLRDWWVRDGVYDYIKTIGSELTGVNRNKLNSVMDRLLEDYKAVVRDDVLGQAHRDLIPETVAEATQEQLYSGRDDG